MLFIKKRLSASMPAQRETSEAANPTLCDFLKDLFHSEQFFAQLLPLDIKPNVAVNEAQVFRVIPGDVGAASFKIIVKKQLNESSKFFVRYGAGWTQGTTFVRKLAADQKKRLSLKPKPLLPPATELYYSPKKTHESRRTLQEKTTFSTFLRLPLELRELVYDFTCPIVYPYLYSDYAVLDRWGARFCNHSSHTVRLCKSPRSLFLVNRQVNEEATNTIYRYANFWFCDIDDLYRFTHSRDNTHLGRLRNVTLAIYPDFHILRAFGEDVHHLLGRTAKIPSFKEACRIGPIDRLTVEMQHRCGWGSHDSVDRQSGFNYVAVWKWVVNATLRWNDDWKFAKSVKFTETLEGQRWSIDIEKGEKLPIRQLETGKSSPPLLRNPDLDIRPPRFPAHYRKFGFTREEKKELAAAIASYKQIRYYVVLGANCKILQYTVPIEDNE